MTLRPLFAPIVVLAAFPLIAAGLPKKGEPRSASRLSDRAGRSTPNRRSSLSNSADLKFEVLPETEQLKGVATLAFTARRR